MELNLAAEERTLLWGILLECQRGLLREISRTHHHQFREVLKHKENLLESVLDKLREPVAA